MNSSNYRFTLDMQSEQSQVSLPVRLGDTDRSFYISLTDGGRPFTIENGCLALFVGKKAYDGKELNNYCPIEKNSVIRYDFTEQTANVAGVVECEIRLYDPQGKLITSPQFIMVVSSRASSEDVAISEDEKNIIDQIALNEVARGQAETDRADAENARAIFESSRITNEDARTLAEIARGNAETDRANAETQREQNELTRKINEADRNDAEGARYDNEETRKYNESQRVSAEANRVTAEASRVEAEAIREANAQLYGNAFRGSVSGEAIRVDDVSPLVQNVKCKVRSKNLFNNLPDFLKQSETTWTYENGELYVTYSYVVKFIELEEGKTYTFSCNSVRHGGEYGGMMISAYTPDKKQSVSLYDQKKTLSTVATFTMPKGYPFVRLLFYVGTGASENSATYTDIMLEEGTGSTGYVPYVEDVTVATVTRCSKNIISYPYSETTITKNGITFTDNGDGSITINGTATAASVFYLAYITNLGSTILQPSTNSALNGTVTNGVFTFSGGAMYNSNHDAIILNIPNGTVVDNVTVYPQAEYGTEATNYEIGQNGASYTPNADGTVEGIKSIAPTMTLLTDTENVVIEIEYSQDVNILKGRIQECLNAIVEIQNTLIGGIAQ